MALGVKSPGVVSASASELHSTLPYRSLRGKWTVIRKH